MRSPDITQSVDGEIILQGDGIEVKVTFNEVVDEPSEAAFSAAVGLVRWYMRLPDGDSLAGTLQAIQENIEDNTVTTKRVVSVTVPAKRDGMAFVLQRLGDKAFKELYAASTILGEEGIDPDFMLALMRETIRRGWQ